MLEIYMETYRDEMIRDLSDFLKIPSVKSKPEPNRPYGKGVFDALMFLLNRTQRMDLECVNLFGHMAYIDYGYGDEMVAILTHIDVVPAGEGWTKNPFGGEVENGRIYGRGAMDDKGPAIASLYAIKALSDNSVYLNKKVRLIFGCDEESGWSDMAFYKQHEPLPDIAFSPDGDYPIINCEKGLLHLSLTADAAPPDEAGMRVLAFSSGTRANVVPNTANCLLSADFDAVSAALQGYRDEKGASIKAVKSDKGVTLIASGKSAHGSRPEDGVNAAAALLLFLDTLPLAKGGLNDKLRSAAQTLAHTAHGERIGLDVEDEVSGRLSLNLGICRVDGKQMEMVLDIRYPISCAEDFVTGKIKERFGGLFDINVLHALPSHCVDENSELVVRLKEAYEEVTGQKAYTLSVGGATYARAFENAVTFGPRFPGKPSLEHGPDEYMEIGELVQNADIIANALIKICGQTLP